MKLNLNLQLAGLTDEQAPNLTELTEFKPEILNPVYYDRQDIKCRDLQTSCIKGHNLKKILRLVSAVDEVKAMLKGEFEMKDLGAM